MTEDTINITLSERLRITRQRAGYSRIGMARMLDVSTGAVGNWEKGRVRPDYRCLVAWCYVLGIELSDLGIEKIVCSTPSPDDEQQDVA